LSRTLSLSTGRGPGPGGCGWGNQAEKGKDSQEKEKEKFIDDEWLKITLGSIKGDQGDMMCGDEGMEKAVEVIRAPYIIPPGGRETDDLDIAGKWEILFIG
jgi:hypothetical protein